LNVAVVGAGIAGLRAAQLLERAGVEVTVFEARNRIGGRMWTTRVGGQEFEAGAEWFDAEHSRVYALLSEFGLAPVGSDPRPRKFFFGGRFIDEPEVCITSIDGRSLADALDASAKTPVERAFLEAVALSDEGTDSDQVDLSEWKRFNANYVGREGSEMSAYRLPVSASELCERMAKTISGDIHLGMELTNARDYFGAQLRFVGGTRETFDNAVLAMPPSCLARIGYDGEKWWDGVDMTPTCKVALLFDEPFWEHEGWSGQFMSDLAVQQAWPSGNAIVCYVNGRGVEALTSSGDPVRAALDELCTVMPRARMHFVEGKIVDWRREFFSGGGFPFVPPGEKRLKTPTDGPVRFIGDWTANWMGFVEGALESAERVVEEMGLGVSKRANA
jgi:monoamine oxidase